MLPQIQFEQLCSAWIFFPKVYLDTALYYQTSNTEHAAAAQIVMSRGDFKWRKIQNGQI